MDEFIKILLVILLSSVKFVAGPPFAYYDQKYDFTFFETVTYSVIGGMLGVVIFTFFSEQIIQLWKWIRQKYHKYFKKQEIFSPPVADIDTPLEIHYEYISSIPKKKIFTPRNRRVVKIWTKYGLFGIALLTPVLLSIPIGTILANSLVSNRKKILFYMFISIVFWSVTMTGMFELFHAATVKDLKDHIYR